MIASEVVGRWDAPFEKPLQDGGGVTGIRISAYPNGHKSMELINVSWHWYKHINVCLFSKIKTKARNSHK